MWLLICALAVPFLVVVANPFFLWLQAQLSVSKTIAPERKSGTLSFSMVTVIRTPDLALLNEKINNVRQIEDLNQWILYHDGPADEGVKKYIRDNHSDVQLLESGVRSGKNWVLNDAIRQCSGDIIVFSDLDSLQQPGCITQLRKHFSDLAVGGVCGQRVIDEKTGNDSGQNFYIDLDSQIKKLESALGQLTTNDGKLYAVRKPLLRPMPDEVSDDLIHGLDVLLQKQRQVYDDTLTARIRLPSRDLAHEVERRRRIVCRSLEALWVRKAIFNVFEYGLLSVRLFINKVLRRLIPHALLVALLAFNSMLFSASLSYAVILAAELICFAVLVCIFRGIRHDRIPESIYRLLFALGYIAAGLYGTLLGSFDFLKGESYATWTPKKS
ncbi:MAG: glycosyltransferase [Endozoicomonas sp.]